MAVSQGKGMPFWKHGMRNAISAECWEDLVRRPLSLEKRDLTGVSREEDPAHIIRAERRLWAVHACNLSSWEGDQ